MERLLTQALFHGTLEEPPMPSDRLQLGYRQVVITFFQETYAHLPDLPSPLLALRIPNPDQAEQRHSRLLPSERAGKGRGLYRSIARYAG